MKYIVYSPDEIPIQPRPFTTEQGAKSGLDRWMERFTLQGFYKDGRGNRIPLEQLRQHCRIQSKRL